MRYLPSDRPEDLFDIGGHYEPTVVELDVSKIDARLRQSPENYVGPHGQKAGKLEKHQNARRNVESGEIYRPIMSAGRWDTLETFRDTVEVRDGRHRLFNLFSLGYSRIEVVVPAVQKAFFLQVFG